MSPNDDPDGMKVFAALLAVLTAMFMLIGLVADMAACVAVGVVFAVLAIAAFVVHKIPP